MRITLCRAVWAAVALAATAPASAAQGPGTITVSGVVIPPGGRVRVTVATGGLRTTVLVPDGGSALVAGSSRVSEGRKEHGVPVAGKLPFAGRGLRNVGAGRSVRTAQVRAAVRVISLRDEEYRQTGFRSP